MESNKEPKLVTCQLVSSKFQDKKGFSRSPVWHDLIVFFCNFCVPLLVIRILSNETRQTRGHYDGAGWWYS